MHVSFGRPILAGWSSTSEQIRQSHLHHKKTYFSGCNNIDLCGTDARVSLWEELLKKVPEQ